MSYSVDTSGLLDGWVRNYPPDVFPFIWQKLSELIAMEKLVATEAVEKELERKHDEVYAWAKSQPLLFVPFDKEVQTVGREILKNYPRLLEVKKGRSGGDPFVIALARIKGFAVVMSEARANTLEKPNIPDVCEALDIRCIRFLDLIREQGWKWTK